MFNNNFEYNIHQIKTDNTGNYIITDITIEGERMTLVNIYGPNVDNANFYQNILDCIEYYQNDKYIICGDFNLVLNHNLDTKNYLYINHPKAQQKLIENMEAYDLKDPFRELYPNLRRYTWRKKTPFKQARLDFFLITNNLMPMVEKVIIENSYRSDHSGVVLSIKLSKLKKGKGLWKFNNSLLTDKDYVKIVKETVKKIIHQYAALVYDLKNLDLIPKEEIQFTINSQLFLETLLMEIRGITISFSVFKKKKSNDLEKRICDEIKELEQNEIMTDSQKIENKKSELLELRKEKLKGHYIRSKSKWIEEGEKPTKFFCNLESKNYYSKLISKIQLENGREIKDQREILKETKLFYQNLYSAPAGQNDSDIIEELSHFKFNKLTDEEPEELEGEIKYSEILLFLKNMKNDKSPGSDGFSAEFFKFFWIDIGHFIVRSINYSYTIKEMSNVQKLGIITCIPKPNKPKQFLKNWRPLTLLNCTYKMASGCIANRIKKVLDKIIDNDQTGFIKGRYIGENIRLIYDIMQYTEHHEIPGLLLLIDFEKAFDSISWFFINKVLDIFNFKTSIKNWIKTFYNNSLSSVIQNGFLSEAFKLERGCRQGDPLSPYIFILCAEILAIIIRNSVNIKGINIDGEEYRISQYADDTSFMLDGSPESLYSTLSVLDYYAHISGLKINYSKSKVIWIGKKKFSKDVYHHTRWKLEWGATTFTLLGINFSVNLEQIIELNYDSKIIEIQKLMKVWSIRILTVLGRITVLKSLILPKLVHLLTALPNPSEKLLKHINTLFFKFIWHNNHEKLKRTLITQDHKDGGIKMININNFMTAIKCTWIRRMILKNSKWITLFKSVTKLSARDLIMYGDYFLKSKNEQITNTFWRDTLASWVKIQGKGHPQNVVDILSINIWYNSRICIGNKPFLYKHYFNKGISFINDLLNEKGDFLIYEQFIIKYDITTHFLEYASLIKAIKTFIYNLDPLNENTFTTLQNPIFPFKLNVLLKKKSGCKYLYEILNSKIIISKAQIKYANQGFIYEAKQWEQYYLIPFKCVKDSTLCWFQYRILHRILTTNTFLHMIHYIDSDACSFCNIFPETIQHLFFECNMIYHLWEAIENWILGKTGINIHFSKDIVMFGMINNEKSNFVNWLTINIKYYIYCMKILKKNVHFNAVKNILQNKFQVEKYIYYKNCNYETFDKQWTPWLSLFY
jgi:hypothetical protein